MTEVCIDHSISEKASKRWCDYFLEYVDFFYIYFSFFFISRQVVVVLQLHKLYYPHKHCHLYGRLPTSVDIGTPLVGECTTEERLSHLMDSLFGRTIDYILSIFFYTCTQYGLEFLVIFFGPFLLFCITWHVCRNGRIVNPFYRCIFCPIKVE